MSLVDNATSLRVVFNSGESDCTAASVAEQVTFEWRELPADPEGWGKAAQPSREAAAAPSPPQESFLLLKSSSHRGGELHSFSHFFKKSNLKIVGISRFPHPASVFMHNKVWEGSPEV